MILKFPVAARRPYSARRGSRFSWPSANHVEPVTPRGGTGEQIGFFGAAGALIAKRLRLPRPLNSCEEEQRRLQL